MPVKDTLPLLYNVAGVWSRTLFSWVRFRKLVFGTTDDPAGPGTQMNTDINESIFALFISKLRLSI